MILRALEVGYRHIDTAQYYDNEKQVGDAMRASGVTRDEIFVTTKVWIDRFAEGDLERSVEESLGRLRLESVDLVLLHWPNPAFPIDATVRALCRTRTAGLARHVGLSNFPLALMGQALAAADEPLVANEVEFHPFLAQRALLEALRNRGMALVAHTPLGRGWVAHDSTLRSIAASRGRTPSQIALRWLLQHPGVAAIPGSTNEEHLKENFAVFGFELSPDEMRSISSLASPAGRILEWPEVVARWDEEAP